jgi:hypothetical protein
MKYHYEQDGNSIGPVNKEDIQKLINDNVLNRDSKIWCPKFTDWKKIAETEFDVTELGPPPLSGSSINNKYIWFLAFAPIIGIILEHAIANIAATNAYEAADNIANHKFIAATFWINIIFSWLDVKQLKKAGHDTSKFKSWLLLVPVYIYLRCEETKVNLAPFIIWIVLFIITFL